MPSCAFSATRRGPSPDICSSRSLGQRFVRWARARNSSVAGAHGCGESTRCRRMQAVEERSVPRVRLVIRHPRAPGVECLLDSYSGDDFQETLRGMLAQVGARGSHLGQLGRCGERLDVPDLAFAAPSAGWKLGTAKASGQRRTGAWCRSCRWTGGKTSTSARQIRESSECGRASACATSSRPSSPTRASRMPVTQARSCVAQVGAELKKHLNARGHH